MSSLKNFCNSSEWRNLRNSLLKSLRDAVDRGLVDKDIIQELEILNSVYCITTSSSCSGRIALFAAPTPGDKKRGGIIAKWHRPIAFSELLEALKYAMLSPYRFVWVSSQPVLVTLHTCDIRVASELIKIVDSIGFKYSGIKITNRSYYIMVIGTERIDIPLRIDNSIFLDINDIEKIRAITTILNTYISLAKRKLEKLKRALAASKIILERRCEEATLY